MCVRGPHSSQDKQPWRVSSRKFENRRCATEEIDAGGTRSESCRNSAAVCLHKNVSPLLNRTGPLSGTYRFFFGVVFRTHKSMSLVPSNVLSVRNVKATEGLHLTRQSCSTCCTVSVTMGLIPASIVDGSARKVVDGDG